MRKRILIELAKVRRNLIDDNFKIEINIEKSEFELTFILKIDKMMWSLDSDVLSFIR